MAESLQLKKSNCKNCYKCIRHCPVKSISFSADQAHILTNACILCGECVLVCPQDARQIINDTSKVKAMIRSGIPVYVSIAPAFIANYDGAGIESMRKALQQLGFADVEETAVGATMVKNDYERILREEDRDIFITSCCHSVNLLIQKHFPNLLPYLANVLSPMQAHCNDLRRRHPGCRVVFIGPCLAKKDEVEHFQGIADAALTFNELTDWMKKENVWPEKTADLCENSRARFFPTPGGVLKTMTEFRPDITYMAIDGIDSCMEALHNIESGAINKCFIEMNACKGSCIGGPAMDRNRRLPVTDYMLVAKYAGNKDFDVEQPSAEGMYKHFSPFDQRLETPSETAIREALKKMGKTSKADELNCGSCGYNSCREKAIAICHGKAQAEMCLPFIMRKTQTFSDSIVSNTPTAIIVLNSDLEIQMVNPSAKELFGLDDVSTAIGGMVVDYVDPEPFLTAFETGETYRNEYCELPAGDKFVNITVVYEPEHEQYMALMIDSTEKVKQIREKRERDRQTAEVADRVVAKQLKVVQEIAYLLADTTAETKSALFKLKESMSDGE